MFLFANKHEPLDNGVITCTARSLRGRRGVVAAQRANNAPALLWEKRPAGRRIPSDYVS